MIEFHIVWRTNNFYSSLLYLHALMRSTTKLKHILQLYTVALEMDEDGQMRLMIFNKNDNSSEEFINKSYSIVVDKAFRYMIKKMPPKTGKHKSTEF